MRFNEAAGIPRGRLRPIRRGAHQVSGWRFNEAAGIPRGRQEAVATAQQGGDMASMRPRVFPAEDVDDSGVAPDRE